MKAVGDEGGKADLPQDNAVRVAIFDEMARAATEGRPVLALGELHDRVIGRLRVLVPRELHNTGEGRYVQEKVEACIGADMLDRSGDGMLALGGTPPPVRYPDDTVREYPPGLEPARERLDADNTKLREASFDVRRLVGSVADDPGSAAFRALVGSMREHGFLKQFAVLKHADGVVVDGRAREKAAAEADVEVEWLRFASPRDRVNAQRRDTPLQRVLLALDANAARLTDEERLRVHEAVAATTGRGWAEIAADLDLTQTWRRAVAPPYTPVFSVRLLPYRPGGEPRVHVTADGKVQARSLVQSAGLAGHWVDKTLKYYVAFEKAKSDQGGGREAMFAHKNDLIDGIERMLAERRQAKRKRRIEPEWDEMLAWLRNNLSENGGRAESQ